MILMWKIFPFHYQALHPLSPVRALHPISPVGSTAPIVSMICMSSKYILGLLLMGKYILFFVQSLSEKEEQEGAALFQKEACAWSQAI